MCTVTRYSYSYCGCKETTTHHCSHATKHNVDPDICTKHCGGEVLRHGFCAKCVKDSYLGRNRHRLCCWLGDGRFRAWHMLVWMGRTMNGPFSVSVHPRWTCAKGIGIMEVVLSVVRHLLRDWLYVGLNLENASPTRRLVLSWRDYSLEKHCSILESIASGSLGIWMLNYCSAAERDSNSVDKVHASL